MEVHINVLLLSFFLTLFFSWLCFWLSLALSLSLSVSVFLCLCLRFSKQNYFIHIQTQNLPSPLLFIAFAHFFFSFSYRILRYLSYTYMSLLLGNQVLANGQHEGPINDQQGRYTGHRTPGGHRVKISCRDSGTLTLAFQIIHSRQWPARSLHRSSQQPAWMATFTLFSPHLDRKACWSQGETVCTNS